MATKKVDELSHRWCEIWGYQSGVVI